MVRWTGKLAVLALVVSLWASPLMACMIPDAHLTVEERECCKNMADDCGQMEMLASHSCCQMVAPQIESYLVGSRFPATHLAPAVTLFVAVEGNPLEINVVLTSPPFHAPSPPVSPDTNSILRV
jgi:hypothetical protein